MAELLAIPAFNCWIRLYVVPSHLILEPGEKVLSALVAAPEHVSQHAYEKRGHEKLPRVWIVQVLRAQEQLCRARRLDNALERDDKGQPLRRIVAVPKLVDRAG